MSISYDFLLIVAYCIFLITVFVICWLFINRFYLNITEKQAKKKYINLIDAAFHKKSLVKKEKNIYIFYRVIKSAQFDHDTKLRILENVEKEKFERKYIKKLRSPMSSKKLEAIQFLGALGTEPCRIALEKELSSNKNSTIKLYLANALSEIKDSRSIPVLVDSLLNENRFYRSRVNILISEFGHPFYNYLTKLISSYKIEIKELIVDFSEVYYGDRLKNYLINILETRELELRKLEESFGNQEKRCLNCIHSKILKDRKKILCEFYGEMDINYCCRKYKVLPISVNCIPTYHKLILQSAECIAKYYPEVLDSPKYLNSYEISIKKIAIRSIGNHQSNDKLSKLIPYLSEREVSGETVNTISKLIEETPIYLTQLTKAFFEEEDQEIRKGIVKILSLRIEYFVMKLLKKEDSDARKILHEILVMGRTGEIIDFLDKNKDMAVEDELVNVIKDACADSRDLKFQLSGYLNDRVLKKCGFRKTYLISEKRVHKNDKKILLKLFLLVSISFLLAPCIYTIRHYKELFTLSWGSHVRTFALEFNYYIAFYSLSISLVYLTLLVFSYVSLRKQKMLWSVKDFSMLFKKRMLPSISILAPAFNEEKTIIESINSLLNLKYPNYELIIINDGSTDRTLEKLIKNYGLTRVDYMYDKRLSTKHVNGVYLNRNLTKLIVVDKVNGGKADSLNVGINIANKEYICGIDADSLLEEEALIRLASMTIDEKMETPALGGNVLPINGCSVGLGNIDQKILPKSLLGKIQTVEYVRAFMSGRLGWAYIKCLLIISGAFGLFRKERVIDVGGYLTSSERYQLDTVGEDMELVVRINRQMREKGKKYKILCSYNANCWTEVPEKLSPLRKQRERWHRGLIEIVVMHKNMILNPRYGRTGLIAMPYFFFFEVIGPMFEFQGYVVLIISAIIGILNKKLALLLFITIIMLGILLSISSLIILEKNERHFSTKQLIVLVFLAIFENLGIRQYFSLWRFETYLKMFIHSTHWHKSERKGFNQTETKNTDFI